MRILIAEDDIISRLLLERALKNRGHEVLTTCDGREALAILEQENPPQIAILDWMMPEIDGVDICRRIRERPAAVPIYLILLTTKSSSADIVAGLEAGADDYITKPLNAQELSARLQAGIRIIDLQLKLADRVRELEVALMRLSRQQQAQKLEAIGQMAAGIAHEINTPTQFIGDNIHFLRNSWSDLLPLLKRTDDPEVEYIIHEVPKAVDESLAGLERVSKIVRAMRDFSHPCGDSKVATDINSAIATTITISTSEWKYVAEIETALDPDLPLVLCLPDEINQVLLNLIVNAAHAIEDVVQGTGHKGRIRIATSRQTDSIEISISDSGTGIPEKHRQKVFDPFFTTKEVGRGTGQGLAIAHSVVVREHNGRIWFETEVGKGTSFFVLLPIDGKGVNANEQQEASLIRR